MGIERITFEIVGTSPLLMNNPVGMAKPTKEDGVKVKRVPPPEEEARGLLYVNEDGHLWGPAMGFRSGLVAAAKGRKLGKLGAGTVLKGAVFCPIEAERTALYNPKTKKPLTDKDYTVDSRRVVLTNNGKKVGVVRSRPRIEEWACLVHLDVDTDLVALSAVDDMLKLAGKTIGYLDFRPQCSGSFGRFDARMLEPGKANKK